MGQLKKNLKIPIQAKKTVMVYPHKNWIKLFASVRDTGESIQGTYKGTKK